MGLRNFFDSIEPHFLKGGKLNRYFAIYEMVESFIYTPKFVTKAAPHARDVINAEQDLGNGAIGFQLSTQGKRLLFRALDLERKAKLRAAKE